MNLFNFSGRILAAAAAALKFKKVSPPKLKAMAGDPDLMRIACETLVSAYRKGGSASGIDWSDLDLAAGLAATALGEALDLGVLPEEAFFLADAE